MYEERKEKFSFKSFFLTLLLVLLFVFLMLWLFPTRWDVKKLQSTYDIERLSVLYDEIFANNVGRMKDGAIGYFTDERMPQSVGEVKKLTLKEMYDLHLVLKLKDKDGNPCDTTKSYVEMTKFDEEYRLKVNLSCGDDEDYIIVYLGCYTYCHSGICEKQANTPLKPTTPVETPVEDPNPITKKYLYEYKLVTEGCTNCTNFGAWQKEAISESDSVKVETKVEKEISGYKTISIQVGTKTDTVVVGTKTEKYVVSYTTMLVLTGTKEIQIGTTTKEVTEKVQVGTAEIYAGIGTGTSVPGNTSTTTYKVISVDTPESCSYCTNETYYTWEIYNIEPVYDVVSKTITVPVYKTINIYEEQVVPVYGYRTVDVTEEVVTPIYQNVKVPEYADVTYYRSQTCTYVEGSYDIKWSSSKFDSDLLDKGYVLTGNVKEA